jgi:hypothetical protein
VEPNRFGPLRECNVAVDAASKYKPAAGHDEISDEPARVAGVDRVGIGERTRKRQRGRSGRVVGQLGVLNHETTMDAGRCTRGAMGSLGGQHFTSGVVVNSAFQRPIRDHTGCEVEEGGREVGKNRVRRCA